MNYYSNQIDIHIELNSKCSMKCLHCSNENNDPDNEININAISKFLKNSNKYYKYSITFTGGEPLLYNIEALKLIIETAKSNSSIVSFGLFTSGCTSNDNGELKSVSKSVANYLQSIGITFVYVSLYNHIDSLHDDITHVKGSHSCLMESIENFISQGIQVNVNYVLMKNNIVDIPDSIRCFFQFGISNVRLLRLVKHGRAIRNWNLIGLSDIEQEMIIQDIIQSNEFTSQLSIGGFPKIHPCQPHMIELQCHAGSRKIYIDVFGDIYPCGCVKNKKEYIVGNIHNNIQFPTLFRIQPQNKCYNQGD